MNDPVSGWPSDPSFVLWGVGQKAQPMPQGRKRIAGGWSGTRRVQQSVQRGGRGDRHDILAFLAYWLPGRADHRAGPPITPRFLKSEISPSDTPSHEVSTESVSTPSVCAAVGPGSSHPLNVRTDFGTGKVPTPSW